MSAAFTPPMEPAVLCFIGEPRSGKSTLIKSLLHHWAKSGVFKYGLVITGSKFNGDFDFIKNKDGEENDVAVWDGWDEERFNKYTKTLEKRAETLKKKGKKLPRSFLILDDLLAQITGDAFKSFLSRFRHYQITVLLATQYAAEGKSCSTLLRSITDCAFMFPSMMHNQVDAMFRAWGGYFKNPDELREALMKVKKEDHACLLYQKDKKVKEEAYLRFKCTPAPDDFAISF